jgi:hypothetical protein
VAALTINKNLLGVEKSKEAFSVMCKISVRLTIFTIMPLEGANERSSGTSLYDLVNALAISQAGLAKTKLA